MISSIAINTQNSIQYKWFQVLWMIEQFYLTHRLHPNKHYHSSLEWTWE